MNWDDANSALATSASFADVDEEYVEGARKAVVDESGTEPMVKSRRSHLPTKQTRAFYDPPGICVRGLSEDHPRTPATAIRRGRTQRFP